MDPWRGVYLVSTGQCHQCQNLLQSTPSPTAIEPHMSVIENLVLPCGNAEHKLRTQQAEGILFKLLHKHPASTCKGSQGGVVDRRGPEENIRVQRIYNS